MQRDENSAATRGLRRYITLVAQAVGIGAESTYLQMEPVSEAYLALSDRLVGFPERDVALLWDEKHGWALALETHGGADLIVLGYLGLSVLPAPQVVARYVADATAGRGVGDLDPPDFSLDTDEQTPDVLARLADYAPGAPWLPEREPDPLVGTTAPRADSEG